MYFKAPYRHDLIRKTLRALNRPGRARTDSASTILCGVLHGVWIAWPLGSVNMHSIIVATGSIAFNMPTAQAHARVTRKILAPRIAYMLPGAVPRARQQGASYKR